MKPMLIVVFALTLVQSVWAATPAVAVQEIAVVRTWGELAAQPEIELADGLTVRFGIQADEQAVYDGVLVYCLVNDASKVQTPNAPEVLGPLAVKVGEPGAEELLAASVMHALLQFPVGEALYVHGEWRWDARACTR